MSILPIKNMVCPKSFLPLTFTLCSHKTVLDTVPMKWFCENISWSFTVVTESSGSALKFEEGMNYFPRPGGAIAGLLDWRAHAGLLMERGQVFSKGSWFRTPRSKSLCRPSNGACAGFKDHGAFASLIVNELLQASTSIPIELSEVFESRDGFDAGPLLV